MTDIMKGYTPGPWAIDERGFTFIIHKPGDGYITRDVCRMDGSTMAAFDQRANARLIASAPEMVDTITRLKDEIARLKEEVERLRDMVRRAYNDGFGEGIKEHTTHKGGNPWHMSKWPAALTPNQKPTFTTGHCPHKKAPGGCPLHNLQCGYPDCDRAALTAQEPRT
jgi:hypothetical protein